MGVKVATAYIDIKLGSFTEFKEAAERRAKETAQRMAKRMTEDIQKNVSGVAAGEKIGQDVTSGAVKKMGRLRSAWNSELSQTAREASGKFVDTFGVGLKALGAGDFKFFSKAMGLAAKDGVAAFGANLKALSPAFQGVYNTAQTVFSGVGKLFSLASSGFSKFEAGLGKISAAFETMGRKIGFAAFMAQSIGSDLLRYVTLPAGAAAAAFSYFGLKAGLDLEQARASLAPFVGGLKQAQKEIDILAKIAQDSPAFDTIHIVEYAKSLISAGLTVDKTNALFKASSNIFTTLGLSVDQANGAFYAITQIMQKGTAQSEELSQQLAERGVPIWKILADSIGVSQSALKDMVKEGKITSQQFVDAMIKAGSSGVYLKGAAQGADTLRAKMANLREQVQYKLGVAFEKYLFPVLKELVEKWGPRVSAFLDKIANQYLPKAAVKVKELSDSVDHLIARWNGLDESTKNNVKQLLAFAIAAGPAIVIISRIASAIAAAGTIVALFSSTIGLILIALGALAVVLYRNKDAISSWLKNTDNGRAVVSKFKDTLAALKNFWDKDLQPVVQRLGQTFSEAITGITSSSSNLKGVAKDFQTLKDFIVDTVKTLGDTLGPQIDKLKSSFKDLGINIDFVKASFFAITVGIKVFVILVGLVVAVISSLIGTLVALVSGIVRIVTDILVGGFHTIVGIARLFTDLFTGEWGKLAADVKEIWDGLWMLVIGTIWDAIMTVIDAVVALVMPIIKWFKFLYDVLVGHSIVPDLCKAIIAWFVSLPGAILGALASMVSSVVAKFTDMKNQAVSAISDLPGKIAGKIGEVKDRALSAVAGFGSLLVNAGRELVQGLINGIDSKLGALASKAAELASQVAKMLPGSPVKEGPLRVLNNGYAGAQIVKMIAEGMNPKPVEQAAYNVAYAAVPPVRATGVGLSGSIDPGAGGGITINQTVNVPNAVQDPKDMADYSTRRLVSAITNRASG